MIGHPDAPESFDHGRLDVRELRRPPALVRVQPLELFLRLRPACGVVGKFKQLARLVGAKVPEVVPVLGPGAGEPSLEHLSTVHLLLDGPAGDEPVHDDVFGLADAIRSVHRLRICSGIPRGVVDDDPIRGGQREPEAAHLRGEQRQRDGRRGLESLHPGVPLVRGNLAVDANQVVAVGAGGGFQHIEHRSRLAEHQGPVTAAREVPEQGHQKRAFSRGVGRAPEVRFRETRGGDGGGDGEPPRLALVPVLLLLVSLLALLAAVPGGGSGRG